MMRSYCNRHNVCTATTASIGSSRVHDMDSVVVVMATVPLYISYNHKDISSVIDG